MAKMNNHDNNLVHGVSRILAMAMTFVCAAACVLSMTAGASVAHADDSSTDGSEETGTINLSYQYQGKSLEGATVNLYRVADWNNGVFKLNKTFSGVHYDWDTLMDDLNDGKATSDEFQQAAWTLDAYASDPRGGITADDKGTIYQSGASFSGLGKGLYLVSYNQYRDSGLTCGSSASLVSIPTIGKDDTQSSTVDTHSKSDCSVTPETPETTRISVSKAWRNDKASERPSDIEVDLIGNGKVVSTATLNAAGNWSHTWNGLDASTDWKVVERNVPAGYTVSIARNADEYNIVNTETRQPRTGSNVTIVALAMVIAALAALLVIAVAKRRQALR